MPREPPFHREYPIIQYIFLHIFYTLCKSSSYRFANNEISSICLSDLRNLLRPWREICRTHPRQHPVDQVHRSALVNFTHKSLWNRQIMANLRTVHAITKTWRKRKSVTCALVVSWHEIYTRAKVNLYLRQRQSIHCSAVLNLLPMIDASRLYTHLHDTARINGTMNMAERWHQAYFSRQFIIGKEYRIMHVKCQHYTSDTQRRSKMLHHLQK